MKPISRFVGTTILGGVLFLTPIVVLGFVLSKAFDVLRRGLKPLTALIPDALGSGPTMTTILTILLLATRVSPGRARRPDASRAEDRERPWKRPFFRSCRAMSI